ncbi:MAG: 1-acyl-sn-glycerol-3-phosphate acyltransferase, partial [Shewanella sp.]
GSFICERFSFGRVELGLLPFGVLGLTLFGVDLLWAIPPAPEDAGFVYGFTTFIAESQHYRLMLDFFMIGVSGGLFIVPLYAFIQSRSPNGECAQAIAANNIMNSLFMVVSALLSMLLLGVAGWTIPQLFLLLAMMNAVVALYIYSQVPEFTQRFISYLFSHVMYRVTITGRDNIPKEGAGILVCNHVSDVGVLIIMGVSARPIRFVMDKSLWDIPLLKYVLHHASVIPICSPKLGEEDSEDTYDRAFEAIHEALANDELVCIFPEGRLTSDGKLGDVCSGMDKILARDPVPVIPMALHGLWGACFSHKGGDALAKMPQRFGSRVSVDIADAVDGKLANKASLRVHVASLLNKA